MNKTSILRRGILVWTCVMIMSSFSCSPDQKRTSSGHKAGSETNRPTALGKSSPSSKNDGRIPVPFEFKYKLSTMSGVGVHLETAGEVRITIRDLTLNGVEIALRDNDVTDDLLKTRDYGDIQIVRVDVALPDDVRAMIGANAQTLTFRAFPDQISKLIKNCPFRLE